MWKKIQAHLLFREPASRGNVLTINGRPRPFTLRDRSPFVVAALASRNRPCTHSMWRSLLSKSKQRDYFWRGIHQLIVFGVNNSLFRGNKEEWGTFVLHHNCCQLMLDWDFCGMELSITFPFQSFCNKTWHVIFQAGSLTLVLEQ